MKRLLKIIPLLLLIGCSNKLSKTNKSMVYFQVNVRGQIKDWRDSAFVVATSNPTLIAVARAQLQLPEDKRKMINGGLLRGDGGYNSNASYKFGWHLKEDDWVLADFGMELCDGRAYSDVDLNIDYWINTVTRFCPWDSYIKREL